MQYLYRSLYRTAEEALWPIIKRHILRTAPNAPIEDKNGVLHFKDAEKSQITGEFLRSQFINKQPETALSIDPIVSISQPSEPIIFSTDQVKTTIKTLKPRKAPGVDNLPPKAIKLLPEKAINSLVSIFNNKNKGEWYPKEWKVAKVVTIPKKDKDKGC